MSAQEADMRWLCSVAMLLAFCFAGSADVHAGQGDRERSIDELPVTTEVDRTGDFMGSVALTLAV
jgi:virginiamycin B lyase